MENTKIIFSVEDIQVIQDATEQFSRIRLKISRAGPNAHHLPISDNALLMAAPSLVHKPILCHIIKNGTAMGGHESGEQAIGFLDEQFIEEIDGQKWQCATALIWKIYFPDVISIFQKSKDNSVSVSMEINVLAVSENDAHETVIEQYEYTATTLIGVEPAIPLASATMIEFSKAVEEYESKKLQVTHFPRKGHNKTVALSNSLHSEFDYEYATTLKSEYPSVWNSGGRIHGEDNFSMWTKARSEEDSKIPAVQDWVREREKYGARHSRDKSVGTTMSLVKWGLTSEFGVDSMKKTLESEKEKHDNSNRAYFDEGGNPMPYSKLGDINPSLKGIDPPITLGQANAIAKQADAVGADKGGWGIAIKHFKDSHEVKDGKWVEKDSKKFEKEVNNQMEDKEVKDKELDMASPPDDAKKEADEEKKEKQEGESKAEEKKEGKEGEAKEEKTEGEPKEEKMAADEKPEDKEEFCLNEFEFTALMAAMGDDGKDFAEEAKKAPVDYKKFVKSMAAKMAKMAEENTNLKKDNEAYMSRMAEESKQKFSMAIESLLKDKDISESLSKDEVDECRNDSVNFSLETVSGWENKVKALAFTHAKGKKVENKVLTYALPFTNLPKPKDNGSVWPAQK